MRIPRIYTPQPLALQSHIELEEQASIHLSRVLRFKLGQQIELFNGSGEAFLASLTAIGKKSVSVSIDAKAADYQPSPLHSEIAIAVSKGDKMELIVQKATELGVNAIYPLISSRTDVKLDADRWQKKLDYWQQVSISACEQCGRNDLVMIHAVQKMSDYLQNCTANTKLICHPIQAKTFKEVEKTASLAMCFGSEGGLTDDEIQLAVKHGFTPLSMGPRILRAETAPIAALGVAQTLWGDW